MATENSTPLNLSVLDCCLSVCKYTEIPNALFEEGFCAVVRTADEISVVCETANVPAKPIAREDGWRALKVAGPLDFGLVGILAMLSTALADAEVPLFAISTYDTDYVLVKGEKLETALDALRRAGCIIMQEG